MFCGERKWDFEPMQVIDWRLMDAALGYKAMMLKFHNSEKKFNVGLKHSKNKTKTKMNALNE